MKNLFIKIYFIISSYIFLIKKPIQLKLIFQKINIKITYTKLTTSIIIFLKIFGLSIFCYSEYEYILYDINIKMSFE